MSFLKTHGPLISTPGVVNQEERRAFAKAVADSEQAILRRRAIDADEANALQAERVRRAENKLWAQAHEADALSVIGERHDDPDDCDLDEE